MKQEEPILVAIHCLVYNHEPYLRDCFEGFVMQKTNFRFVAVVHDDVSTDNSAAIIREYSEKYPDIFRPIYETENQWSKPDGSLERIMNAAIDATGAKYIAMCEGDDYWIDPYKLQKQVDYMEAHPEYSMCFHKAKVLSDIEEERNLYTLLEEREYSAYEIYKEWLVPTCSVVYRVGLLPNENSVPPVVYGDIYMFLRLAEKGKFYNLNFEGAVYRRNSGGVSQRGNVSLYVKLLKQYKYMEKRFPQPDLVEVSRELQDMYLKCIIASAYFPDRWKYRMQYMRRHPRLFFSKFLLITLWQMFHKPNGKNIK